MVVTAGDNLDARHQALASRFSTRYVRSRWRYMDELPWDDDFESEPITARNSSIPSNQPSQ